MTITRTTGTQRSTARQRRLLEDLVALSATIQERRRETEALVARRHREYQRLYDAGIPVGVIAREIGVTPWAVRQHLRRASTSSESSTTERSPAIHLPATSLADPSAAQSPATAIGSESPSESVSAL